MGDKPIRLLFVFPLNQLWGGEKVWLELLSGMDKKRFAPKAVVFGHGPLDRELDALGIPYAVFKPARVRNVFGMFKNIFALAALMRGESFDLVNSLGVNLAVSLAALLSHTGCILHIHTMHRLRLIDRWCLRLADRIITVCEFVRDMLIKEGPGDKDIRVVYNSIDPVKLRAGLKGTAIRRQLGLADGTLLVCYSGRIVKWKNLEFLVKAIPLVNKKISGQVRFLLVGQTPAGGGHQPDYHKDLAGLAQTLKVSDQLVFTGFREDIADILDDCDIFVIPSLMEVFSVAVLEAMAMAKPVVAMRTGGNPELISTDSGIMVEGNDMDGFVSAIAGLLNDPLTRKKMGQAGYDRVVRLFDPPGNIKGYEAAFTDFSGKR